MGFIDRYRFDLIGKYCRKDVEITRDIFLFGRENGYLLFADKAGHVVRAVFRGPEAGK